MMALTKVALAQLEADAAKAVAAKKQASALQLLAEQKAAAAVSVEPAKEDKLAALDKVLKGPFTANENGTINCTLVHPVHGDLPFTADPDDPEEHGRLIHEIAQKRTTQ